MRKWEPNDEEIPLSHDEAALGKTWLRRGAQFRDRWTAFGTAAGILSLSERLSAAELRQFEIFAGAGDAFLERISPDISVAVWAPGSRLFEAGSYLDLAFFVVEGEVEIFVEEAEEEQNRPIFDLSRTGILAPGKISVPPAPAAKAVDPAHSGEVTFLATMDFDLPRGAAAVLGPGEVFGEIGALSGWPQSVTARTRTEARLLQIRLPALRLLRRKDSALRQRLDAVYRERSLLAQLRTSRLFGQANDYFLQALKEIVELVSREPGEAVAVEGETADALYLVRSGFLRLSQRFGDGELSVSYLSKGMIFGEVEFLLDGVDRWQSTASSVEHAELVRLPYEAMKRVLESFPEVADPLWQSAVLRIKEAGSGHRHLAGSEFLQVALDRGLVQGSSLLVIDLDRCTRCDDCVSSCAATHGGRPRFVREGDRLQNLLVPRSCYHCRDPVCLIGCPTGAIHRAGVGDVVEIDEQICIGCSTCANACPYDAIVMHETGEAWPADMVPAALRGEPRLVASKCDLCHDTGHDPACVSGCPQGCAFRVGSLEELSHLLSEED
jgi:Fe-S-cluster-containing dehydrogenase component/CRP-like cAMP-binding protein